MTGMFDPYQQWLGIPTEEQPPHYYRLLGVALFEPNLAVIEAAAMRQMSYLLGCQSGAQGELAKRLLSEVAAAKACLLSPLHRAAYDQQLKRYLESRPPVASHCQATPAPPILAPELVAAQTVILEKSDAPQECTPEMARKRREAQRLALAGIMCAGLLLIAALVVWQSSLSDRNRNAAPEIVHSARKLVDRQQNDEPQPDEASTQSQSSDAQPPTANEPLGTVQPNPPQETPWPIRPKHPVNALPPEPIPAAPRETPQPPAVETVQPETPPSEAAQAETARPAEKKSPAVKDVAAAGNEAIVLNQWTDILGKVDVGRDVFAGDWKRGGETITAAKADFARLLLPVRIRGNYDLEVEFVRTDGAQTVAILLPLGDRLCAFVLGEEGADGIELVSGMSAVDPKNTATRRPTTLQNKRVIKALIRVRRDSDKVQIVVIVNGSLYLRAGGFARELSLPEEWSVSDTQRPAVGVHQSSLLIRGARFRLNSGDASFVTGKSGGELPADDSRF